MTTKLLIQEAVQFVRRKIPDDFKPAVALTLGSGLSNISKQVRIQTSISYSEIPGFVHATTSGHPGELVLGEWMGKSLAILSGRVHFYEGYSMSQITFPVRFLAAMGIETLILTAAVGGINRRLRPGDFIVVKDHVNLMGTNPLIGPHDPIFGERFPDLSECYLKDLQKLALQIARKNKIRADSGIYCAVSGPSYETPSEIRAFGKWGADVVGMSVVPESIAARQMGLKVLALCHVSNMASGISSSPLSHQEVLESGKKAEKDFSMLIGEIIKNL